MFRNLPRWARRIGRASFVASYAFAAAAGALGLTWPSDGSLEGWGFLVTRIAGGLMLGAGLVLVWAQLRQLWLVELEAIPALGFGLTGYAAVLMLHVGPAREWLLMVALIGVILSGLVGRSAYVSHEVDRMTRAARRAA